MAYQLIYTSAPRCLEAGRSGFGTVARHRGISPLLVSVIERASQFSRLPGTDLDRMIFCHRIINLGAAKFHLLSAIRDAGADYTGRTNHIAHHLVVEPREIAQLGTSCPSPAQILSNMPWATSWNDTPRYFADSEEVSLASLRSSLSGNAWAYLCGSPDQGWLLSSGDTSRGAYLVHHPATDLREIFDESLRLIPDRLWQISFTTSLQPSDEVSDFRWIGVEEQSPMRARAEVSSRAILNLADPSSLPRIEAPQQAAALPIFSAPPPTVSEQGAPSKVMPANFQPVSDGVFSAPSYENVPPPFADHAESIQPQRPVKPKKLLRPIAIGAFVLLIAMCLSIQLSNNSRKAFEDEIDNHLHFYEASRPWAEQLKKEAHAKGRSSRQDALKVAELAHALLKHIDSEAFDEIESDLQKYDLIDRRRINIPHQLNELIEQSKGYIVNYKELTAIKLDRDNLETLNKIESAWPWSQDSVAKNRGNSPLHKLESKLTEVANNKRADAIVRFLCEQNRDSIPPIDSESLKTKYPFLTDRGTGSEKHFRTAKRLVEIWEMVSPTSRKKEPEGKVLKQLITGLGIDRTPLPKWLSNLVDPYFAKETPKPKEATVLPTAPDTNLKPPLVSYYLGGKHLQRLKEGVPIKELQSVLDSQQEQVTELLVNGKRFEYLPLTSDFRTSFSSDNPEFKIERSSPTPKLKHVGKIFLPEKSTSEIKLSLPEFKLIVIPVAETRPPNSLTRHQDKVKPSLDFINSSCSPTGFFLEFKPHSEKYYQVSNRLGQEVDFSGSRNLIDSDKLVLEKDIEETNKKSASLKLPAFKNNFLSLTKALESLPNVLPSQRDNVNTFLKKRFKIELIVVKDKDELGLCDIENQHFRDSLKEINQLLTDADKKNRSLNGKKLSKQEEEIENQKSKFVSILEASPLKELISKLAQEHDEQKAELEKIKATLKTHIESQKQKLQELEGHPYCDVDKVPPGTYEISAESGIEGIKERVPLYRIDVP
jgi:hypothetical protein